MYAAWGWGEGRGAKIVGEGAKGVLGGGGVAGWGGSGIRHGQLLFLWLCLSSSWPCNWMPQGTPPLPRVLCPKELTLNPKPMQLNGPGYSSTAKGLVFKGIDPQP